GDALTVSYTGATFADKNAGTGKTVTVRGIALSGPDAGNYTLTKCTATTTADITPAVLRVGLATSAPISVPSQPVTFTATFAPFASGSILFKDGTTTLATVALVNGMAAFTTDALLPG